MVDQPSAPEWVNTQDPRGVLKSAAPIAPAAQDTYYKAATRALLVGLRDAIEELCVQRFRVPDSAASAPRCI